ncbi:beta-galactosidase [Lachnospiraceae bacterium KM106-2]|nr:beta-galactosidase [Lachnospiraceae bacterium KM106-2]
MKNYLDLSDLKEKEIWDLGENFSGKSTKGNSISFTNYYMCKDGKPFYGISGEFHFSRMEDCRWEDEIIKMKLCGINVIATYVFWIHHEEEEGVFDFSGRRNLRKFIELCGKHEIYVILRIGPFDHGEVRNGGIPDWMYGKPFEVRQLNEGFLYYTRRLYTRIGKEIKGLFFQDGGPIIGTQIDNEYMHSSAPWEITTGISNEWVFSGNEGDAYMLKLKDLAAECGMNPVFYTCTGWGGASTPANMMPLWGGYAFRPWLFYSYKGKHPSTEEYVYQDFHNNEITCSNDFQPNYQPEDKPYACCEMGGGMMCSYYYRFILPYKSVDAMANIKMASGCNFLGYYVFQGGSNPVGKHGTFLNEGQVPKISYDYQAPLGEFGQLRESYERLKCIHFFANTYSDRLCGLTTVLPDGASKIAPTDLNTLRFAVRTDGKQGFVFINNYQDHEKTPAKDRESIVLKLQDETILYPNISLAGDENCILPFHFDMDGIDLVQATAQLVTEMKIEGEQTYLFLRPEGMSAEFVFEEGVSVNKKVENHYIIDVNKQVDRFHVTKEDKVITILCISRELCNQLYLLEDQGFVFTKSALLVKEGKLSLETTNQKPMIKTYPANLLEGSKGLRVEEVKDDVLGTYEVNNRIREIQPIVKKVSDNRYTISFPPKFMNGMKDALLRINYQGDIGHAFINGEMINDNFCNGDTWEIGLRSFADQLERYPLTIYITPLKEGVNVNVESSMAARIEESTGSIGEISKIAVAPVYEIRL